MIGSILNLALRVIVFLEALQVETKSNTGTVQFRGLTLVK